MFCFILFCFVIKKDQVLTYSCHDLYREGVRYTEVHHFHHESLPYVLFHVILSEGHDNPAAKIRITNETGPLPLCTFSVMGLSMCSSMFSDSSPVRSKSGIM